MKTITIAADSKCAHMKWCFSAAVPKKAKEEWCQGHDLFLSDDNRVFCLVQTSSQVYFMDAITGSLYSFGECKSSSRLKLKIDGRNQKRATSILLSIRGEE